MNKTIRLVALAAVAAIAVVAGCENEEETPVEITDEPRSVARRLTVDQLADSMPVVMGSDVGWQIADDEGTGTLDAFEQQVLGATLGRPDYLQVTDEPAAVDALYLKLMDDMARNVCDKMVQADASKSDDQQRELTRFIDNDETSDADAINENLRYLTLRFHGRNVTDDAGVADLKAVFDGSVASEAPSGSTPALEGWRGVCIALLKSPAFHIY